MVVKVAVKDRIFLGITDDIAVKLGAGVVGGVKRRRDFLGLDHTDAVGQHLVQNPGDTLDR